MLGRFKLTRGMLQFCCLYPVGCPAGCRPVLSTKGVSRRDMDLLLDVLDDRPKKWREQGDQLAALLL